MSAPDPSSKAASLLRLSPGASRIFLSPSLDPATQAEEETRFFSSLRLSSGVFKSTGVARLRDVDRWLLDHLPAPQASSSSHLRPLRLLDVAISSGITTCEWASLLSEQSIDFEMKGSDLCIDAWLLSFGASGSPLKVLLDSNGYPLQYDIAGLGLRTASNHWLIDLPFAFLRLVCRMKVRLATLGHGLPTSRPVEMRDIRLGLVVIRPVQLVTAALRNAPSKDDLGIELFEENLLSPTPNDRQQQYDLIRAANILNRGYFEPSTLRLLAERLRERLRVGGRLLIVQTRDDVASSRSGPSESPADSGNSGTLFERTDQGLAVVNRYGRGSDIEELILSTTAASDSDDRKPRDRSS